MCDCAARLKAHAKEELDKAMDLVAIGDDASGLPRVSRAAAIGSGADWLAAHIPLPTTAGIAKGDTVLITPESGRERLMRVSHVERHVVTLSNFALGAKSGKGG